MRRLILSLLTLVGLTLSAHAQVPCIGVTGVNSIPFPGVGCLQEPSVNTFAASSVAIVPASSATDLVCMAGKAGTVVRVQRISVSASAGTAVAVPVSITKNATADTAGTQATGTALPVNYSLDPLVAASLSVVTWQANTANPTINDAAPGILDTRNLGIVTTTAAGPIEFSWYGTRYSMAPILRAVAQQVCVNLNGTSITSGKINIGFQWTEAAQ